MRSPATAVEVVNNRNGWYVNVFTNNAPTASYGPMAGPITIPQAMRYVAMMMDLDQ